MQDHKKNEKKAQKIWEGEGIFKAEQRSERPKFYCLDMFPYPSGDGLHVGHAKGYFASDIIARYKILKGYNVLHPMGWDAFGLPAENYAIKIGKHPRETVAKNITKFKSQMQNLGLAYDWSREIDTTDPNYYKWTQWIFLKMYERGLAYEAETPINYCPSCKTGLANEEVVAGKCERCETTVIKKKIKQWLLKITAYADRLLKDIDKLDWPEPIKEMQRNWIGRSEGAVIKFEIRNPKSETNSKSQIQNSKNTVEVFTTRADTLFGATYIVIAPENEIIEDLKNQIENFNEVEKYIDQVKNKSDLERTDLAKEKTGVESRGIKAINPINKEEIPVWISDYVLASYGTGAVMAVPAHDARDFEFATKFELPVKGVISKGANDTESYKQAYEGPGHLINSDEFDGLKSKDAAEKITEKLKENRAGDFAVNYKLRDWIFSRQRYWGEPIPIIHCKKCGVVPVPEKDLPVELPDVKKYEPTGTGESPLAAVKEWVNVECPKCGGPAKRETNTMPQWAGSCWYYLRYINPKLRTAGWDKSDEKYWMPIDLYIGGAEHAVLHLLYTRFWHKVLYDEKLVSEDEPFKKLQNVGLILAPDGRKMSKSLGNVINPDDVAEKYGVDAYRMYKMFMGPFDQPATWSTGGINGTKRFIDKVFDMPKNIGDQSDKKADILIDALVKDIGDKIEKLHFNTAVSSFMKFINDAEDIGLSKAQFERFLIVLSPFAPHTAETLWQKLGHHESIFKEAWPKYEEHEDEKRLYVVQINGKKVRTLDIQGNLSDNETEEIAKADEKVSKLLLEKKIIKVVIVKGKVINFVVE